MRDNPWVFEIIMDEYPEWDGNRLYDEKMYAKFCGEQDFLKDFPTDNAVTWEVLMKGTSVLYEMTEEGNIPTGVELRVRHVDSLYVSE